MAIQILFNKNKYIEFSVSESKEIIAKLREEFGPEMTFYEPRLFAVGKHMIPHVEQVLKNNNLDYKITEDWI